MKQWTSLFGATLLFCASFLISQSKASGPIKFHHFGRYDVPPRVYGYKLDEDVGGYYGGGRYREYYHFGRGYGYAGFPGPLPSYHGNYLPKRYWPYGSHQVPKAVEWKPCEAYICVNVPADAEIWLEDHPTTQKGHKRLFKSPPLHPNKRFLYKIHARWSENGEVKEQTRNIQIQGGRIVTVSFPSSGELDVVSPPLLSAPPIKIR